MTVRPFDWLRSEESTALPLASPAPWIRRWTAWAGLAAMALSGCAGARPDYEYSDDDRYQQPCDPRGWSRIDVNEQIMELRDFCSAAAAAAAGMEANEWAREELGAMAETAAAERPDCATECNHPAVREYLLCMQDARAWADRMNEFPASCTMDGQPTAQDLRACLPAAQSAVLRDATLEIERIDMSNSGTVGSLWFGLRHPRVQGVLRFWGAHESGGCGTDGGWSASMYIDYSPES